jgi:hypothetical protein
VLAKVRRLLRRMSCRYCREELHGTEMVAIWCAGGEACHLACWAQHHNVIRSQEARS